MTIRAIRMPKWGLSMEEGTIVEWLKSEGDEIAPGDELMDIETTKITNVLEATAGGRLARIVAGEGAVMPVGALIGVLVEGAVPEAEIDAFVAAAPAVEAVAEADGGGPALEVIEAGGLRFTVATAGEGSPLVLLHGFAGDHDNWMLTMEDLRGGARVIAPDLPGHGASDKSVGDGSLAALSDAVAALLDEMGLRGAVVAGHSLGGALAMRLALDRPDLVARLVLVCPAGLPGGTLNDTFLRGVTGAEKARDVKAALRLLVRDPALVTRDMVDGVVRFLRLDGARAALETIRARLLEGAELAALQDRLADLPDTGLILGGADAITGAPDLGALPGGWAVHRIDEAGHLPQLETPAAVAAILRDTL